MRRTALVTGANRGLGFETARQLGRLGITVLVGARDPAKGEAAADRLRAEDIDARPLTLDVRSTESVRAAAERVREDHGALDILVNNAGILPEAARETAGPMDVAMFRETYETNVFGAVTAIHELLPLLRESEAGRIVNVSSTMGSLADQTDPSSPYYALGVPAYRTSKLALTGITVALARHLEGTAIKVNAICPGSVQTDLAPGNREAAPTTPEEASRIVVEMATLGPDGPSGAFVDGDGTVAW
ncbi:MAG TPA: SDR family oxidoreductase [Solirubrobacteraceae bacterium]|nr:SDR family oxidoreductase [Solirubrobacteraceae bacterium]